MTNKPLTEAELLEMDEGPRWAESDGIYVHRVHLNLARLIAEVKRAWSYEESTEAKIGTLFDAIAHGDDTHRAWLKAKIEEHFR